MIAERTPSPYHNTAGQFAHTFRRPRSVGANRSCCRESIQGIATFENVGIRRRHEQQICRDLFVSCYLSRGDVSVPIACHDRLVVLRSVNNCLPQANQQATVFLLQNLAEKWSHTALGSEVPRFTYENFGIHHFRHQYFFTRTTRAGICPVAVRSIPPPGKVPPPGLGNG